MADDPLAPKGLNRALKQIRSMRKSGTYANGKPKLPPKPPDYFCNICLIGHDGADVVGIVPTVLAHDSGDVRMRTCAACQKELDAGRIAVTCRDKRYAFIYSPTLAEHVATTGNSVIEISSEAMDKVFAEAKARQEKAGEEGKN